MPEILPDVYYIPRSDYADPNLARRGYTSRDGVDLYLLKTDVAMHHSVSIDSDATPDIWETFDEILVKSRYMQTVRWEPSNPSRDLGPDNPYSHMLYLMPGGVICIVEGRGYSWTTAATKGHNTGGWALVWMGNFQGGPIVDVRPWIPAINRYLPYVKQHECPNLVVIKAHRAYSQEDGRGYTACCGDDVIAVIDQFSLEDDMPAEELEKKMNRSALLGQLAAMALADAPATPTQKLFGKAVIDQMKDAPRVG